MHTEVTACPIFSHDSYLSVPNGGLYCRGSSPVCHHICIQKGFERSKLGRKWWVLTAHTTLFSKAWSVAISSKRASSSSDIWHIWALLFWPATSQAWMTLVKSVRISAENSWCPVEQNFSFLASLPQESPAIRSCKRFCSILVHVCFKSSWIDWSYRSKKVGSGLPSGHIFKPKLRHINSSRKELLALSASVRSSSLQFRVLTVNCSSASVANFTDSSLQERLCSNNRRASDSGSPSRSSTSARAASSCASGSTGDLVDVLTTQRSLLGTTSFQVAPSRDKAQRLGSITGIESEKRPNVVDTQNPKNRAWEKRQNDLDSSLFPFPWHLWHSFSSHLWTVPTSCCNSCRLHSIPSLSIPSRTFLSLDSPTNAKLIYSTKTWQAINALNFWWFPCRLCNHLSNTILPSLSPNPTCEIGSPDMKHETCHVPKIIFLELEKGQQTRKLHVPCESFPRHPRLIDLPLELMKVVADGLKPSFHIDGWTISMHFF